MKNKHYAVTILLILTVLLACLSMSGCASSTLKEVQRDIYQTNQTMSSKKLLWTCVHEDLVNNIRIIRFNPNNTIFIDSRDRCNGYSAYGGLIQLFNTDGTPMTFAQLQDLYDIYQKP